MSNGTVVGYSPTYLLWQSCIISEKYSIHFHIKQRAISIVATGGLVGCENTTHKMNHHHPLPISLNTCLTGRPTEIFLFPPTQREWNPNKNTSPLFWFPLVYTINNSVYPSTHFLQIYFIQQQSSGHSPLCFTRKSFSKEGDGEK